MSRLGSSMRGVLLQEIPAGRPPTRLADIDAARGVAIILVVVGHVVARDMPLDNEWYAWLKESIYRFHMPLFMALTGVSFALSLPVFESWRDVAAFSAKRVQRLLVAYVLFGLLILAGKVLAARFMLVDNPARGGLVDVATLLLRPGASVAGFLWFIYVLSIYLLILPAAFQACGRRPLLLLIVALVLQWRDWPSLFMLREVVEYLPFFAGGMVLWVHRSKWERLSPRAAWLCSILFAALLLTAVPLALPEWLVGAASVLPVLAWMQRARESWQQRLAWIGRHSLSIYLINTIAIGVTKGLLLRAMPWDGLNFLLYFPLLTAAGIGLPLLVKAAATRHAPTLARYM